ncbi:Coenzyme F390 synthetase [Frankia canadensis]|uniref:Coenzyme F390 synthetase n=1 Tax=Frankia canadensis TaxID=1836972 RepID=A0A2I2KMY1_9ACTN|nr:phenylacetate--CoA ligase family protein [Frankia canadensis]SNQ47002.1 Coenzyme F390 synthetase [Frankia canadensis]SOU54292.1 Coenzyme F390 synthetase [Frankia canadensis]
MTTVSALRTAAGATSRLLEPEVETAPIGRIRAEQQRRVVDLARLAQERSALHGESFAAAGISPGEITSLEDFFARVPFMNKDSIRAWRDRTGDAFGGLLTVDPADVTTVTASSGTTGDPTFFVERWTGQAAAPLPTAYLRSLWEMGVRPGDKVLCSAAAFRGYIEDGSRAMGVVPILVDTWMGNWVGEVADVIRRHRPTYCQLMSMNLVELERLAAQEDIRELMSSFVGFSFAGEPLGARMREKLTREWGLDLWVYTSAGDTGLAWECSEHDGFHINWDECLVEVLDADGNPVPDGEVGELVVTALDNDTYPLIRYRTDDLVRASTATCPCGRTSPRVWVLGRAGDETVVAGRAVLAQEVWAVVEQQDETATGLFQIIRPQREVERLRIRVGYDGDAQVDLSDLVRRLTAGLSTTLRIPADLIDILPETADQLLRRGSAAKVPRVAKS